MYMGYHQKDIPFRAFFNHCCDVIATDLSCNRIQLNVLLQIAFVVQQEQVAVVVQVDHLKYEKKIVDVVKSPHFYVEYLVLELAGHWSIDLVCRRAIKFDLFSRKNIQTNHVNLKED